MKRVLMLLSLFFVGASAFGKFNPKRVDGVASQEVYRYTKHINRSESF
jgi:hypothetical protein